MHLYFNLYISLRLICQGLINIHFAEYQLELNMLPPPGFLKPLWRGWEGSDAVRSDLAVAVAAIKHSIGGCHQEEVRRDDTNVPSSNQHLYGQKPTRFEIIQGNKETTRKRENKGNVKEFLKLNKITTFHEF